MRTSFSLRIFAGLALVMGLVLAAWPGGAQAANLQQAGGLTVSPTSDAKSSNPNTSVQYQLTASLAADAAGQETVSVNVIAGVFGSSSVDAASVTLQPGGSYTFNVVVNIPASATPGSSDITTVSFSWSGNPVAATLTTTVNTPPAATPTTPASATRPLVVVEGYYLDKDTIAVGDSFKLFLELRNKGSLDANNLILSFLNESFLPQETGGVVALGNLGKDGRRDISQQFLVSSALAGIGVGTIPVNLSYTDANGGSYTEVFSITLQLRVYSGQALPTATPTQAQILRPQIVIAGYQTDTDPLQPGAQFSLNLEVSNLGNADARAVTLVLGGGVVPDASGTPVPGGVPGGSGDLTNFAPLGSSNLVYLGDLAAGAHTQTAMRLIVNVSANPGAYTLKISFVYTDPKGNRLVDDQVITLLVYQLPTVTVNFYRDPGPIFAGQFTSLPLQVVNLGRKTSVLGNMTVTAEGVEVQNNTTLVGPLDPGGFFTLDSSLLPMQPGELALNVTIDYTDDFNAPRVIQQTITLNVQEAPVIDPGINGPGGEGGEEVPPPVEETLMQKVLRFLKGLIGLDSAPPATNPGIIDGPTEGIPPTDSQPIPLPSGGKGG